MSVSTSKQLVPLSTDLEACMYTQTHIPSLCIFNDTISRFLLHAVPFPCLVSLENNKSLLLSAHFFISAEWDTAPAHLSSIFCQRSLRASVEGPTGPSQNGRELSHMQLCSACHFGGSSELLMAVLFCIVLLWNVTCYNSLKFTKYDKMYSESCSCGIKLHQTATFMNTVWYWQLQIVTFTDLGLKQSMETWCWTLNSPSMSFFFTPNGADDKKTNANCRTIQDITALWVRSGLPHWSSWTNNRDFAARCSVCLPTVVVRTFHGCHTVYMLITLRQTYK